jgi:Zn-dependent M28 family amino/carboxypeptidase
MHLLEIRCLQDTVQLAMQYLRPLISDFLPLPPEFEPRSCHVGFMVNEVSLWQFSQNTSVSLASAYSPYSSVVRLGPIGQLVTDTLRGLSVTPAPRD